MERVGCVCSYNAPGAAEESQTTQEKPPSPSLTQFPKLLTSGDWCLAVVFSWVHQEAPGWGLSGHRAEILALCEPCWPSTNKSLSILSMHGRIRSCCKSRQSPEGRKVRGAAGSGAERVLQTSSTGQGSGNLREAAHLPSHLDGMESQEDKSPLPTTARVRVSALALSRQA